MNDDLDVLALRIAGEAGNEARLQALIIQMLREIKDDIREERSEQWGEFHWLLGTLWGGIVVIVGVLAFGFHWL